MTWPLQWCVWWLVGIDESRGQIVSLCYLTQSSDKVGLTYVIFVQIASAANYLCRPVVTRCQTLKSDLAASTICQISLYVKSVCLVVGFCKRAVNLFDFLCWFFFLLDRIKADFSHSSKTCVANAKNVIDSCFDGDHYIYFCLCSSKGSTTSPSWS